MSHTARQSVLRLAMVWAFLFVVFAARAGLYLPNFTGTNVIQIMPVGDSITDDCVTNGAWRQPMQPLLDSNGIPFNFVGRENSTFTIGQAFTKVHHEGYCGAVIAPPGVSQPTRLYTAAQNYLQYIVPQAFSGHIPHVMLILIGANDIGHGRDPYQTAYVDMPFLLDEIFSNAPNANVILTKITTLSNATLYPYSIYATNVPVYNAQLQAMVNQRRAAGQNVYLADMFSVVDYNTMFNSDHLHPNALGLAAIAKEFYTRVQSIITGTNRLTVSLIHGGDTWSYSDAGTDLGTTWSQPGFDDSAWPKAVGRLGYGEAAGATTINSGGITTYFRKSIVVPWNEYFTNLNFRLTQTAGAAVWLNGQEVYRTNMPAGPVSFSTLATAANVGDPEYIYYQTNIARSLRAGTNVVGVEVHQNSTNNPLLGFDMELLGGAVVINPPLLTASVAGSTLQLTWPLTNGFAFSLYSASRLNNPNWQPVTSILQTNNGQISTSIYYHPNPVYFQLQFHQ